MTAIIIALIIVIGFVFMAIEIFLVPGFSIPGLAGIAMIGYGIFKAKVEYGIAGVFVTVAVSIVSAVVLIALSLRSRTLRKVSLEYSVRDAKAVDDYSSLIGKEGVAISSLRPSGTADIDGKRLTVVTNGVYIERDTPIRVAEIDGTRIVVAPRESTLGESTPESDSPSGNGFTES